MELGVPAAQDQELGKQVGGDVRTEVLVVVEVVVGLEPEVAVHLLDQHAEHGGADHQPYDKEMRAPRLALDLCVSPLLA